MSPKWPVRAGVLFVPLLLIGGGTVVVVRQQEQGELERGRIAGEEAHLARQQERLRRLGAIPLPITTSWLHDHFGRDIDFDLVQGAEWPDRLGQLPGLERGCDFEELVDHRRLVPPVVEGNSCGPETPISWLRWQVDSKGHWVATAIIGEDTRTCCHSFWVVAIRKNW